MTARLPTSATIEFSGSQLKLALLTDEAPVTIARFAALARSGYYNGQVFYRVLPGVLAQTGSPDANDHSAAPRFMRDETGLERHTRGAVGMSTHGRDTGTGQFFIDLVDTPHFDHEYTVFASVVSGMEIADRLLEGATVVRVTVR